MKKTFFALFIASLFTNIFSCYKPITKETENKEDVKEKTTTYYSLKISTNIEEASNYSINVDDINKIEEGRLVSITNTPGYYKIVQFLGTNDEQLSSNNSYSFVMDSNKEN